MLRLQPSEIGLTARDLQELKQRTQSGVRERFIGEVVQTGVEQHRLDRSHAVRIGKSPARLRNDALVRMPRNAAHSPSFASSEDTTFDDDAAGMSPTLSINQRSLVLGPAPREHLRTHSNTLPTPPLGRSIIPYSANAGVPMYPWLEAQSASDLVEQQGNESSSESSIMESMAAYRYDGTTSEANKPMQRKFRPHSWSDPLANSVDALCIARRRSHHPSSISLRRHSRSVSDPAVEDSLHSISEVLSLPEPISPTVGLPLQIPGDKASRLERGLSGSQWAPYEPSSIKAVRGSPSPLEKLVIDFSAMKPFSGQPISACELREYPDRDNSRPRFPFTEDFNDACMSTPHAASASSSHRPRIAGDPVTPPGSSLQHPRPLPKSDHRPASSSKMACNDLVLQCRQVQFYQKLARDNGGNIPVDAHSRWLKHLDALASEKLSADGDVLVLPRRREKRLSDGVFNSSSVRDNLVSKSMDYTPLSRRGHFDTDSPLLSESVLSMEAAKSHRESSRTSNDVFRTNPRSLTVEFAVARGGRPQAFDFASMRSALPTPHASSTKWSADQENEESESWPQYLEHARHWRENTSGGRFGQQSDVQGDVMEDTPPRLGELTSYV